jgi:hypothetical protein
MAIPESASGDQSWYDDWLALVRATNTVIPAYISGRYYIEPGPASTALALTQSRLRVSPRHIPESATWDRIGSHVTVGAASSVLRWGIYADSNGYPGALLLDTGAAPGTVDSSVTGLREATISHTLAAGRYWIGAVAQGGAPTVHSIPAQMARGAGLSSSEIVNNGGSAVGYFLDAITGALPNPFTAAAGVGGNAPACWMRKT